MAFLPEKYRRSRELDEDVEYVHEECQGQSARLFVKYTSKGGYLGWVFHCFSCEGLPGGLVGFHRDNGSLSPSEARRLFEEHKAKLNPSDLKRDDHVLLPEDFTTALAPEARQYVLKYDLTEQEIITANIGWSAGYQRMIIPVYQAGKVVMWQGRYFGDLPKMPKHLTVAVDGRQDIFYNAMTGAKDMPDCLVLVESAISAIKLSRFIPTIGLLGSAIPKQSQAALAYAMRTYQHVFIWLDPDKHAASIKIAARLRNIFGVPAISVLTNQKPKSYTTGMAKEVINDHRNR